MFKLYKCQNFINQLNENSDNHPLFTTNIGQKNGVRKRSLCFCFDRLWASWNRVSYNKNRVAQRVVDAFNAVKLSSLNISDEELRNFYVNLLKINEKFSKSRTYDDKKLQPLIKLLGDEVYQKFCIKENIAITCKSDLVSLKKGSIVEGNLTLICKDLEFLPEDIRVRGDLRIYNCEKLKSLSKVKVEGDLIIERCRALECLSEEVKVGKGLRIYKCQRMKFLMEKGLKLKGNLIVGSCKALRYLSKDIEVEGNFGLYNCNKIESLPEGFIKGNLIVGSCRALRNRSKKLKVGKTLRFYNCRKLA